jgi:hypothetical protein
MGAFRNARPAIRDDGSVKSFVLRGTLAAAKSFELQPTELSLMIHEAQHAE